MLGPLALAVLLQFSEKLIYLRYLSWKGRQNRLQALVDLRHIAHGPRSVYQTHYFSCYRMVAVGRSSVLVASDSHPHPHHQSFSSNY